MPSRNLRLRKSDVLRRYGISAATFDRLLATGQVPPPSLLVIPTWPARQLDTVMQARRKPKPAQQLSLNL